MECDNIKKLIPALLSGELGEKRSRQIQQHFLECAGCAKELKAFEKSWDMLGELKDVDPDPAYVARFWTRLSVQKPWHERLVLGMQDVFKRPMVPAYIAACVILVIATLTLKTLGPMNGNGQTALSPQDREIVENLELVEDLEIIEDMEFFEDFEVIENLDSIEA